MVAKSVCTSCWMSVIAFAHTVKSPTSMLTGQLTQRALQYTIYIQCYITVAARDKVLWGKGRESQPLSKQISSTHQHWVLGGNTA